MKASSTVLLIILGILLVSAGVAVWKFGSS